VGMSLCLEISLGWGRTSLYEFEEVPSEFASRLHRNVVHSKVSLGSLKLGRGWEAGLAS
jgi:hypothetical protein